MNKLRNNLMLLCLIMLCTALVAVPASALVGEILLTFESVPGITPGTSQQGAGVQTWARLSTQMQMSHGVSFSSTASYVAVVNLGSGHATSGATGIGGVNASNILTYNQPIVITFTMPGSPSTPAVTNFVSIRGDQRPATGSATMQAFDLDGAPIESVTAPDRAAPATISSRSITTRTRRSPCLWAATDCSRWERIATRSRC